MAGPSRRFSRVAATQIGWRRSTKRGRSTAVFGPNEKCVATMWLEDLCSTISVGWHPRPNASAATRLRAQSWTESLQLRGARKKSSSAHLLLRVHFGPQLPKLEQRAACKGNIKSGSRKTTPFAMPQWRARQYPLTLPSPRNGAREPEESKRRLRAALSNAESAISVDPFRRTSFFPGPI